MPFPSLADGLSASHQDSGQVQGLMRLAGWRSRTMIGRFGASPGDRL